MLNLVKIISTLKHNLHLHKEKQIEMRAKTHIKEYTQKEYKGGLTKMR
jgi:hypothetical protein